ncbi:MAG: hypothetical protein Tsb005_12780 [Gammaproteobacteria bacterium]
MTVFFPFCKWQDYILQDKKLYYARPKNFNDPFDCNVSFLEAEKKPGLKEAIKRSVKK